MILNLTQHPATPEQTAAGVVTLEDSSYIHELLTFDSLPTQEDIEDRAASLADFGAEMAHIHGCDRVMIGGAPYLMPALERALRVEGVRAVYAFSRREVVEQTMPDGSVRKTAIFRHEGFVPAGTK